MKYILLIFLSVLAAVTVRNRQRDTTLPKDFNFPRYKRLEPR